VHVDACFASVVPDRVALSAPMDDAQESSDQIVSECCHFCSGTAIASFAAPAFHETASAVVPSTPARSLITFKLPATAPPPKA
jgi:hypothetical protein